MLHYPKHFPRSSNTAYFQDMSAWAGFSNGVLHVRMRLPGMAGSVAQLRFDVHAGRVVLMHGSPARQPAVRSVHRQRRREERDVEEENQGWAASTVRAADSPVTLPVLRQYSDRHANQSLTMHFGVPTKSCRPSGDVDDSIAHRKEPRLAEAKSRRRPIGLPGVFGRRGRM